MPDSDDGDALPRIQALFQEALERPRDAWPAFLEREVQEPTIREEVRSLLEAHASQGAVDDVVAALAGFGDQEAGEHRDREPPVPRRIGPYHVAEALGEGGMATVYRGRLPDDPTAPWVALKVLRPEANTVRVRKRFMAERQILAGLEHPNIARLLDDGLTSDAVPFLVTELVEGLRIDRHCQRQQMDLAGRLRLFLQVCRAVEYAHSRSVVHRDLKPDNVLVTTNGQVRLLDFGIAKILDGPHFPGGTATTSGIHVLTLSYASPEQIAGEAITPASDIYQLGLLLVKIVTGRVPPPHERWPQPREIDVTLPEGAGAAARDSSGPLRRIVRKALSVRPADRHGSVGDLIRDVQGLPVLSPRRSHLGFRKVLLTVAALLLALLLGALVASLS